MSFDIKKYELSDSEYNKYSKMSWDDRLKNKVCPECLHKMYNEPDFNNKLMCLEHGTPEQINLHKPLSRKKADKKFKEILGDRFV